MERYRLGVLRGRRPSFDSLPHARRRRIFGVDYAWVRGLQGGELFFTRQGWAIAEALLPEHWFDKQRYRNIGCALPGATGAVYHVPVAHPRRRRFSLVVKFSRFAQDIGITQAAPEVRFGWPEEVLDAAEFSDPFSEFSHVETLRRRSRGNLRTKHPLAIYCPVAHHPAWQLGRSACRMSLIEDALASDQAERSPFPTVRLERERAYVLIYQWIEGLDLEHAYVNGAITREEMTALTQHAAACLHECGYAVADHKPKHIIVRRTQRDKWLRRRGKWIWALVDYELLVPSPALLCSSPPLTQAPHA